MNRESAWQRWLSAIGAERRGGELVAPCPLASQPDSAHREGGDPYKVVLSPGAKRPVVLHCRCCGSERLYDILREWGVGSGELQRMAEAANFGRESESQPQIEYDFDLLHRAYSELLRLCPLTAADREWLRQRGVSDALADYCGYGSIPADLVRRGEIGAKLRSSVGLCDSVPGLRHPSDCRGPGIAIPCRSSDGRIRAVKVRLTEGRVRMRYLSSRRSGGLPAVSDLHFPLCDPLYAETTLYVTEGERKADVLSRHVCCRTVAVPGVGCVANAVGYVVASGLQAVTLAFDADAAGEAATVAATESLRRSRWRGELRRGVWGGPSKGIDDVIAAGAELKFEAIELGEPPVASPHTPRPRSLSDALGVTPSTVSEFRRRFPQFNAELTRQIESGELQTVRVAGVGLCVGSTALTQEEWHRWIASNCR